MVDKTWELDMEGMERGCAFGKGRGLFFFFLRNDKLLRPRQDRTCRKTSWNVAAHACPPALFSIGVCLLCLRDVLGQGWKTVS